VADFAPTDVRAGASRVLQLLNGPYFYASRNATMRFCYAIRRVFGEPGFELTATPLWCGLRLSDERLIHFRRVGLHNWRLEQLSQRTAEMLSERWQA
jgi:hypothetical protein